ncbi:MAG TPA: hypothetical protein VGF94_28335 [Kofleriaceae bacterium]|jgi:hypothetical protein
MTRALLLVCGIGVGLMACKSSDQPAAATEQPAPGSGGAAGSAMTGAGKVLEVSGQATIAGKPAVVGQAVAADDVVVTGDDGRVTIELAHNLARWQVGPGKHEKVSDSIAWKLPRNEGNANLVIQDMTSAGRPAERSAADSVASAPQPSTPPPQKAEKTAASPARVAAPSPPPAPPAMQPAPEPAVTGGEAHTTRGPMEAPRVDELLSGKTAELHACLDPAMTTLTVTVDISATGAATAHLAGDASAAAKACVARVIAGLKFPAKQTTASISITR